MCTLIMLHEVVSMAINHKYVFVLQKLHIIVQRYQMQQVKHSEAQ